MSQDRVQPGEVWELTYFGHHPTALLLVLGPKNDLGLLYMLNLENGRLAVANEHRMLDESHGRWRRFA